MKHLINIIFYFSTFLSLLIFGCGDDTVTPPPGGNEITVNGQLVDNTGSPVGSMRVMIGGTMDTTDANGNFSIGNVTAPYDVKMFLAGPINEGVMFKGLTNSSPVLVTLPFTGSQNTAQLTVHIPNMVVGQRAFVIFTDQNNIQEQGVIIPPNNSSTLNLRWQGSSSITGKVIVFITNFSNGLVQSYENFGEKNQNITNQGVVNTTFTSGEISTNPGESSIMGTLSVPQGYLTPSTALQLNYKQGGGLIYPFNSGATLSDAPGQNYNFVVPTGLPTSFRFILAGSAYGISAQEFTSKCMVAAEGSNNNLLSLETFTVLTSPANNSTNVDLNTAFNVNAGSGSGVNIFIFDGPDRVFYVVTTQSAVTIPDFSAFGFGIGSALTYDWSVIKFGQTQSIDEFVSGNFYNNQSMVFYSSSAQWRFDTAP